MKKVYILLIILFYVNISLLGQDIELKKFEPLEKDQTAVTSPRKDIILMNCATAYTQDLRNSSNILVGRIESDGIVRDQTNMMIGKIGSDGTILNQNYMTVGKIEKDGTIRDRSNMMIGKVDGDGKVKDRNNILIGRVKPDGTVVDRHNMTVGYAKGLPAAYAAVFYFFKLFE